MTPDTAEGTNAISSMQPIYFPKLGKTSMFAGQVVALHATTYGKLREAAKVPAPAPLPITRTASLGGWVG